MPADAAHAVTPLSSPPALPPRPALFLDMDGVLVGPPRETAATHGLADSGAVMDWLETLAERA